MRFLNTSCISLLYSMSVCSSIWLDQTASALAIQSYEFDRHVESQSWIREKIKHAAATCEDLYCRLIPSCSIFIQKEVAWLYTLSANSWSSSRMSIKRSRKKIGDTILTSKSSLVRMEHSIFLKTWDGIWTSLNSRNIWVMSLNFGNLCYSNFAAISREVSPSTVKQGYSSLNEAIVERYLSAMFTDRKNVSSLYPRSF